MGDIADEMVFAEQNNLDPEEFLITGYPGNGHGFDSKLLSYQIGPSPELVRAMNADLKVTRGPSVIYPTPSKETHMPRSKAQIAREIQLAHDTVQSMNLHIKDLQLEYKKAGPEEPKASRVTVSVWFTPRGKRYEYLMMRPPGSAKWFTTGQGADAVFKTWSDVLAWLNGPDVHNWGHMHTLDRGTEL